MTAEKITERKIEKQRKKKEKKSNKIELKRTKKTTRFFHLKCTIQQSPPFLLVVK